MVLPSLNGSRRLSPSFAAQGHPLEPAPAQHSMLARKPVSTQCV